MVDEEEVFIDIVDGAVTATPVPQTTVPEPTSEPAPATVEVASGASVLEAEIVTEATGQYEVTWPILGMDCPDCAAKATRAMKQMKQVSNSMVSVTSGEVKLDVDLEVGPLFEVASVLRSLGHAPDVEHHELVGVKASSVAQRNDVPVARLNRVIRRQPGVLDVEIMDDDRILLQMVVTNCLLYTSPSPRD